MRRIFCLLLVLSTGQAGAQTTIDLGRQARNVDFSKSMSTRPVKVGSILPSTCVTGELFFHTASSSAQVIYACTATNIWTRQQGDTWPSATGFLSQAVNGARYGRSLVAGAAVIVANGDGEGVIPRLTRILRPKPRQRPGRRRTSSSRPSARGNHLRCGIRFHRRQACATLCWAQMG